MASGSPTVDNAASMTAFATILVLLFGLVICGLSGWGVLSPRVIMRMVSDIMDGTGGIVIAVGVRIVLGIVLLVAAAGSRHPLAFEVLGWIAIIAAVAIVIMGRTRLKAIVAKIAGFPDGMLRLGMVFGVLFGAYLVYATV